MRNSFYSLVTTVALSLFVVSCGSSSSNVLNGVKVETTTVNNEVMMSFSANINLGAMSFAGISLPIYHPRGQTPIGQLELISGLGGVNQIKVSVNMSQVTDIQTTQAVLPNGNAIPLIANNQTIAINIGNGARVYLTLSNTVTAIGVAVPISAFDNLGQTLPGLNFFPIVQQGDVIATAGIFTGLQAGQNGIAVVADVSKIVNLGNLMPSNLGFLAQAEEVQDEVVKLDYKSHNPGSKAKSKLDSMLLKMNNQKLKLRSK